MGKYILICYYSNQALKNHCTTEISMRTIFSVPFGKNLFDDLTYELRECQNGDVKSLKNRITQRFFSTYSPRRSTLIHDVAQYFNISVTELLQSNTLEKVFGLYLNQLMKRLTIFIVEDEKFVSTFCVESAIVFAIQMIRDHIPELHIALEYRD